MLIPVSAVFFSGIVDECVEVPSVEPVYRRSLPTASRPVREVSSPAFGCEGVEVAAGVVEARRMDWARFPCGGGCRRQRAFIHGQEGSGYVPGRWAFSECFIPSLVSGVLYGSFQSHGAMGLLLAWGERQLESAAVSGSGGRRRTLDDSVCRGSKGFVVISFFLRGLCAIWVGQLSSVSSLDVSVFVLYP